MIFVDTSAFYAMLDGDDSQNEAAAAYFRDVARAGARLVTSSYVVCEAFALCQRRLGLPAVFHLDTGILPLVDVRWIQKEQHTKAMGLLRMEARRALSLVDCSSFVVMRELGVERVFAFDRHFKEQGFEVYPRKGQHEDQEHQQAVPDN